jgi:hypothetical protein
VRGLPILAEVAEKYKDRGVVFYAVNVREKPETIRNFLEKRELKIKVALDSEGEASERYGVTGIPQTVLIGKDGSVQVVHVGMATEKKLSEHIEALLEGKQLAEPQDDAEDDGEARRDIRGGAEDAPLEEVWAVRGNYRGVAFDPSTGNALALAGRTGDAVHVLDGDGTKLSEFRIEAPEMDAPTAIRVARLGDAGKRAVVTFQRWGRGVRAFDMEGNELWDYSVGQGVNDVAAMDLNGDDRDEIVIGYNGSTGVHVLDSQGEMLWKYTGIGNVWHVTAGDLDGDGTPEVITTSAQGRVHTFDSQGKMLGNMNPGGYASLVRYARDGNGQPVLVAGSRERSGMLVGMDADGKRLWRTAVGRGEGFWAGAAAAPGRPWLAAVDREHNVVVVEVDQGAILGLFSSDSDAAVGWVKGANGEPLLVMASSRGLKAYRVSPKPDAGEVARE